jgi:TATA-binding protein-associated factor Taf7
MSDMEESLESDVEQIENEVSESEDSESEVSEMEDSEGEESVESKGENNEEEQKTQFIVKEVKKEVEKENEINNLMDIFNLFIQPNEIIQKKKPKNSTFKRRSNMSNRRFTSKNYDFNGR